MTIRIFTLNKENKRKLIEISLIVFSIIIAFSESNGLDSTILGAAPVTFLFISIVYWISLDEDKVYDYWGFKLAAFVISISFTLVLSLKLLQLSTAPQFISNMLFWAYFICFSFIFFTTLTTKEEEVNQPRRHFKSWAKIIVLIIFIVIVFFLSFFDPYMFLLLF